MNDNKELLLSQIVIDAVQSSLTKTQNFQANVGYLKLSDVASLISNISARDTGTFMHSDNIFDLTEYIVSHKGYMELVTNLTTTILLKTKLSDISLDWILDNVEMHTNTNALYSNANSLLPDLIKQQLTSEIVDLAEFLRSNRYVLVLFLINFYFSKEYFSILDNDGEE
jgi:hypothetical protein